ncbi:MAG: DUF302 domain-containing protein [Gammaproteobacteria bacterium]|nr:DUF302 domain-containing protein [Gammaproteobacteria bacterium]
MFKVISIALLALVTTSAIAMSNGIHRYPSQYDVKTTIDRLQAVVEKKGMKVFTRIDHAAGATAVGKTLRPTELLIFGNPKVGTALMLCNQESGIDLPIKALAWRDNEGKVWLSYNGGSYLKHRHGLRDCDAVAAKVDKALANFARAATE